MVTRVMIMAGGTGGHVFPALAVAERLRAAGAEVLWLGTRGGLESGIVPRAGIPLETVRIGGLRGKGAIGWLLLPFRLLTAMAQSLVIIMRFRPMVILGMGGFVAGPGGLVTWLLRKPLLVHEQNAIAGMTNRWLARLATRTLIAFPGTIPARLLPVVTGNPVRDAIAALPPPEQRFAGRSGPLRLLVLGGSQGARGLNGALPDAIAALPAARRPRVRHQAGRERDDDVRRAYTERSVAAEVEPFIDDMAAAYAWADLVVSRAGALTIAELTAAGLGAILVPYPHAVDDHQTRNAAWLVDAGAAVLAPEGPGLAQRLAQSIDGLADGDGRIRLREMALAARRLALPDAAGEVARHCLELAHA
jgi:UDP-N-acetylglucosamine--N-acetylmuramyl-(pentapeptide) pyrophosphoryl-undecaprenol N-acetylglucosamine transferase